MPEVLESKPEADAPVLPEVMVAVPVPLSPRLTKYRKLVLFAAPVLAAVLSWGSAVGLHFMMTNESPSAAVVDRGAPDGARLFAQNCARCHGERGDGRGPTLLDPPARHFGAEAFKFGTTSNRLCPTDADLMRVIREGIPGSAMPAFAQLSEEERHALAGHVRRLTWENLFAKLRDKEVKEFGDYDPLALAGQTDKLLQPGKPLAVPTAFAAATPELLGRGRGVFVQYCAPCHGPEGHGDGPQVQVNENGTPAHPRDLTQGLYKGGGESEDLYARIVLGIPGTPMPASGNLSPQDVQALIAYIRSLCRQPRNGETIAER
ncbi:MAG TPA: c-type cytochrome [Fimbriiglobus sp.]|nr:c-type cytochrome [Fimbriiglobus sp.]